MKRRMEEATHLFLFLLLLLRLLLLLQQLPQILLLIQLLPSLLRVLGLLLVLSPLDPPVLILTVVLVFRLCIDSRVFRAPLPQQPPLLNCHHIHYTMACPN